MFRRNPEPFQHGNKICNTLRRTGAAIFNSGYFPNRRKTEEKGPEKRYRISYDGRNHHSEIVRFNPIAPGQFLETGKERVL